MDSGITRWEARTGEVVAPLGWADDAVLSANERGEVYAVDAGSGRVRWRRLLGRVRIAPLGLGDGAVAVATVDSLYRLSSATGATLARRRSPGTLAAPWQLASGLVLVPSTDSTVLALDPRDLSVRWTVRVDAPVIGAPAVVGDTAWVVTRVGTLYRMAPLSAATPGAERLAALAWPVTTGVVAWDSLLVLTGADGVIRGYDHGGGERFRMAIWPPIELDPIAGPPGLVVEGGAGDLHRYRYPAP